MLYKGGNTLAIADCEILCAGLQIARDVHWQTVVDAVVAAKSLTMLLSQWFAPAMLSKALANSGKDFMALHSRFDGLPDWCVASVERRYTDAMALSPAI
jgi:hypothetical protein